MSYIKLKTKFLPEHCRIMEKNRAYYEGLVKNGTLSKLSSVIVDEFQRVYTEAIGQDTFKIWCKSCVIELIELVYTNYQIHLDNETQRELPGPAMEQRPSGTKSALSTLENKRKNVSDPGRPKGKNR